MSNVYLLYERAIWKSSLSVKTMSRRRVIQKREVVVRSCCGDLFVFMLTWST